jgi:hypothetical protein
MTESPQLADSSSAASSGRKLVAALVGVLLLVVALNYVAREPTVEVGRPDGEPAAKLVDDPALGVTIAHEVDDHRTEIIMAVDEELTVLNAMQLAASSDPAWQMTYEGSGAAAFLTQLGPQQNEGATGKNWQYEVNGQRADDSFGTHRVKRGDRVLWKFAPSE